jgi:hypothetical protein
MTLRSPVERKESRTCLDDVPERGLEGVVDDDGLPAARAPAKFLRLLFLL